MVPVSSKFSARFLFLGAVILLCEFSSIAKAELIVRGFDSNKHDRFANNSAFIGDTQDWSGIGRNTQWSTMISDSFFLSARHAHPGNGSDVTFFHSNDASGASEVRTVAEGWVMGTSDLWLGRLETSVSSSVAKYGILDATPEAAESLEFITFGTATGFVSAAQQRAGRNEVDEFLPAFGDDNLVGTGDVFVYDFDTTGGVGDDEARVTGGDSGGPTFAITDSGPAILGIHWFMYEDDNGVLGSGDTFVPSYISQINSQMSSFGESVTIVAVPEPSGLFCFLLFGVGSVGFRGAKSKSDIFRRS